LHLCAEGEEERRRSLADKGAREEKRREEKRREALLFSSLLFSSLDAKYSRKFISETFFTNLVSIAS